MSIKTQGTHIFFIDTVTSSVAAVIKLGCPTGVTGLGGPADQINVTCLDAAVHAFKASGVPMEGGDPHALADGGPTITDIDVWAVGAQGIYVRRGRRVHEPSSIWLYPWGGTGRKLADTPLSAGPIALDREGEVIFSQVLDYQIDLGLVELAPAN